MCTRWPVATSPHSTCRTLSHACCLCLSCDWRVHMTVLEAPLWMDGWFVCCCYAVGLSFFYPPPNSSSPFFFIISTITVFVAQRGTGIAFKFPRMVCFCSIAKDSSKMMDVAGASEAECCRELKHLDLHPIAYLPCKLWVCVHGRNLFCC